MRKITYLDASALVKLVVPETESDALSLALAGREGFVASRLGATECRRACTLLGRSAFLEQADAVLDRVTLLEVSGAILEAAGRLEPANLRTLDAIHLATALSIGADEIDVITYDLRLAKAARSHGLNVLQPGA